MCAVSIWVTGCSQRRFDRELFAFRMNSSQDLDRGSGVNVQVNALQLDELPSFEEE